MGPLVSIFSSLYYQQFLRLIYFQSSLNFAMSIISRFCPLTSFSKPIYLKRSIINSLTVSKVSIFPPKAMSVLILITRDVWVGSLVDWSWCSNTIAIGLLFSSSSGSYSTPFFLNFFISVKLSNNIVRSQNYLIFVVRVNFKLVLYRLHF